MTRQRILLLAFVAVGMVLLAQPSAIAEYRGSDLFGNIGSEDKTGGGLMAQYPLSHYALDFHVDAGIDDGPEAWAAAGAQALAAFLWMVNTWIVAGTIQLFAWTFGLDIVGRAIDQVGEAIWQLYTQVVGHQWLIVGVLGAGLWGIYKGLARREYSETIGGYVAMAVYVVIAMFFVYQPTQIIGGINETSTEIRNGVLSGAVQGDLASNADAKRAVSDHLFQTMIVEPWAVLNFGGLRHCVDTDRRDEDGFPRPVGPFSRARDICRDHMKASRDGYGGYVPLFLEHAPGSAARNGLYEAIRDGRTPDIEPGIEDCPRGDCSGTRDERDEARALFENVKVDKADAPAVDIQQQGGAYQRLGASALILVGNLGAALVIILLALLIILSGVLALVLAGFAAFELLLALIPGWGHAQFKNWLGKLIVMLLIPIGYTIVLVVALAVSTALVAATASLGFLFSFALFAAYWWALLLYRSQILGEVYSLIDPRGSAYGRSMRHARRMARAHRRLRGRRRAGRRQHDEHEIADDQHITDERGDEAFEIEHDTPYGPPAPAPAADQDPWGGTEQPTRELDVAIEHSPTVDVDAASAVQEGALTGPGGTVPASASGAPPFTLEQQDRLDELADLSDDQLRDVLVELQGSDDRMEKAVVLEAARQRGWSSDGPDPFDARGPAAGHADVMQRARQLRMQLDQEDDDAAAS